MYLKIYCIFKTGMVKWIMVNPITYVLKISVKKVRYTLQMSLDVHNLLLIEK